MDERAYLRRLSTASSSELIQLVLEANPEQQQVLKKYLGPEVFDRLAATSERAATRGAGPKVGNIVVLHGIMGGELTLFDSSGQSSIWVNALRLLRGQFDRLPLNEDSGLSVLDVRATGMYMKFYAAQIAALGEDWEVRPFFFDWRRDIRIAADDLKNSIDSWFGPASQVHLIAHSMGGLVSRSFIARHPDRWKTMLDPDNGKRGGRLLMLGTPNYGSFAIPRLLFGNNDVVDLLSKLNVAHFGNKEFLLQFIRTFIGIYQMMPVRSKLPGLDVLYKSATYTRTAVRQSHLDQAEDFQREIAGAVDPARMVYVAGYNRVTAAGIQDAGQLSTDNGYTFTRRGDGTVPHSLGLLDGVEKFFVDEEHGKLPQNQRVLNATSELLQTGRLKDETNLFFGLSADVRGAEETESQDELRQSESIRLSLKEKQLDQIKQSLATRDAAVDPEAVTPEEQALIDLLLGHDPPPQAAVAPPPAPGVTPGPAAGPPAPTLDPIVLHLAVSHGDLRVAKYPVAVGHYKGDSIVSAEAALDERLQKRLSDRFHLGIYPGKDETVQYVEAPGQRPPGALVIGLGEVGQVTAQKLSRGMTLALLEYAAARLDRKTTVKGTPETLGVSSVLLGTYGGEALTTRDSIKAILEGVFAANRLLQTEHQWDFIRFTDVEIIELYEDQAIQAAYDCIDLAVAFQNESAGNITIDAAPELQTMEGGKFHRPAGQYESGWWRRIKITQSSTNDLTFEVLTDRARSEMSTLSTQRQFIDKYVAETIRTAKFDGTLGTTLFEVLLPLHLKQQTKSGAPVVLLVDPESARYPWEILADRMLPGPLVTTTGLLRQFTASNFRMAPRSSREMRALVLGDTQSGMLELKGAQDEAKAVAEVLGKAGYACDPLLIKQDGLTIGKAFFGSDYRIMHIAAHGVYNPDYTKSGVVIGPDLFLTAAEFNQLRAVPELVFVNCCHLGRMDGQEVLNQQNPHKLAASVAQALLEIGVKAVIAAGWAVSDKAGLKFAQVFYDQMLVQGANFGNAVREARKQTFDSFPSTNTWGAYQAYGNPGFQLKIPDGNWGPSAARRFVARREYVDRLRNIAADARDADKDKSKALTDELDKLKKEIPGKWLDGEVLALFAQAYGEFGRFPDAIDLYRQALRDPNGKACLVVAQESANLAIRYAPKLAEDSKERADLIEEARQSLDWYSSRIDTPKQSAYIAGLQRRLAMMNTGEHRQNAVRSTRDAYRKAYQSQLAQTGEVDPYYATNAVALGSIVGDENAAELLDIGRKSREAAVRNANETKRDFWSRVGVPDADFAISLVEGTVPANIDKFASSYLEAFPGSTPRERSSVFDHLLFMQTMQPDTEQGRMTRDAIVEIRRRIGDEVAGAV